jgi:hypothetical protein
MDSTSIISIVAIVISIGGTILGVINHRRIRSKCFTDKEIVLQLDVESTTPPNGESKDKLSISIPKNKDIPELPSSPKCPKP